VHVNLKSLPRKEVSAHRRDFANAQDFDRYLIKWASYLIYKCDLLGFEYELEGTQVFELRLCPLNKLLRAKCQSLHLRRLTLNVRSWPQGCLIEIPVSRVNNSRTLFEDSLLNQRFHHGQAIKDYPELIHQHSKGLLAPPISHSLNRKQVIRNTSQLFALFEA
jgi:hypothetical protein